MSLNIATITNSIAALTVTGVNIRDKDELEESFDQSDCPLFCPRPNDFVSRPQIMSASIGSGTTHQMDVSYNLTYRYFHAPVGAGDMIQTWSDMVDKVFAILYALAVNDAPTGAIDLSVSEITQFGVVEDGAGNKFDGCDITLRILEHIN